MKKLYNNFVRLLKANDDDRTLAFINAQEPIGAASLMFMAQRSPLPEESQLAGDFILRMHGHGSKFVGIDRLMN